MPLLLNVAADYLVFDALEPVTLKSARSEGTPQQDYVASALRGHVKMVEQAPSGGAYVASDMTWEIPAPLVILPPPKPGDQVVDAGGVVWTVLSSTLDAFLAVYELACRDLAISYDLRDRCTVETPTVVEKDSTGAVVRAWGPRYQNVACRFQPLDDELTDERLVHATRRRFRVYLSVDEPLTNPAGFDRLVDADGKRYTVTGYRDPQRIDELPSVDARLDP